MNILITGGGGFLGRNLIPAFLTEGNSVVVITKSKFENDFPASPNLKMVIGNYADKKILSENLKNIDCIIHLAYSTVPENSTLNPDFDIQSNVLPTLELMKAASENKVKKLIFVSSGGVVYGNKTKFPITENDSLNPISSYGITKMMIENNIQLMANNYGLDFCILRISNAYGPGQHGRKNQGVINIWLKKIMNNETIEVVNEGKVVRDYIHIDDIVDALKLVVDQNVNGVFNIGTGIGTSLNDLIKLLEKILGKQAKVSYINKRGFDVEKNILSFQKFKSITGWEPKISLEAGINKLM